MEHHVKTGPCMTRPAYRDGKKKTAVKAYSISQESNYLLILGVPKLQLKKELKRLCSRYGPLESFTLHESSLCEEFTEAYVVKYEWLENARYAKRRLDDLNFYGGMLAVTHAPEFETIAECRLKLHARRQIVRRQLTKLVAADQDKKSFPSDGRALKFEDADGGDFDLEQASEHPGISQNAPVAHVTISRTGPSPQAPLAVQQAWMCQPVTEHYEPVNPLKENASLLQRAQKPPVSKSTSEKIGPEVLSEATFAHRVRSCLLVGDDGTEVRAHVIDLRPALRDYTSSAAPVVAPHVPVADLDAAVYPSTMGEDFAGLPPIFGSSPVAMDLDIWTPPTKVITNIRANLVPRQVQHLRGRRHASSRSSSSSEILPIALTTTLAYHLGPEQTPSMNSSRFSAGMDNVDAKRRKLN